MRATAFIDWTAVQADWQAGKDWSRHIPKPSDRRPLYRRDDCGELALVHPLFPALHQLSQACWVAVLKRFPLATWEWEDSRATDAYVPEGLPHPAGTAAARARDKITAQLFKKNWHRALRRWMAQDLARELAQRDARVLQTVVEPVEDWILASISQSMPAAAVLQGTRFRLCTRDLAQRERPDGATPAAAQRAARWDLRQTQKYWRVLAATVRARAPGVPTWQLIGEQMWRELDFAKAHPRWQAWVEALPPGTPGTARCWEILDKLWKEEASTGPQSLPPRAGLFWSTVEKLAPMPWEGYNKILWERASDVALRIARLPPDRRPRRAVRKALALFQAQDAAVAREAPTIALKDIDRRSSTRWWVQSTWRLKAGLQSGHAVRPDVPPAWFAHPLLRRAAWEGWVLADGFRQPKPAVYWKTRLPWGKPHAKDTDYWEHWNLLMQACGPRSLAQPAAAVDAWMAGLPAMAVDASAFLEQFNQWLLSDDLGQLTAALDPDLAQALEAKQAALRATQLAQCLPATAAPPARVRL